MTATGLRIIAGKEFSDHLRSRRFHLLFAILAVVAAVGMITGAVQYSKDLSDYNAVQMIAENEDDPTLAGNLAGLKPSVLSAYSQMGMLMAGIGVVLGIAMGFDLVTREKESKSLKSLLAYPVFRDEVINGKALGGVGAIALAMGVVLAVSVAIMALFGIVPSVDEFVRILVFGVASFLLVFTFFALALLMSTVSKDSGSALLYSLIVMIVLSSFVPIFAYTPVYSAVFGDAPTPPGMSTYSYQQSSSAYTVTSVAVAYKSDDAVDPEALAEYERASREYMNQKRAITDIVTLVSPTGNYQTILGAASQPAGDNTPGLGSLLGALARNIIALLAMPAAFFGLAWVRFMREDIR
ncbi:ABC-type transport system involved in multi-copper enzyme maturation, permease component [Methanoculleus chikugoensis]|uniref:ABC-type transport system involved in multi-copper enzyme maturation, permease component n=1 Tax=Methanoculleus chikugoensis TaxID=118126 RepID=A0A1M4MMG3_9EURY|nr:ABC transporter permease subunit [Methanoculleus chikugoensis]SCL76089.1 ABC-type transport system involved in multi-copper enzyme maturation, permease component [Methanoculleus chikugoensis]